MKIGDELICSECGEVIVLDSDDLDEEVAFCSVCGNWEKVKQGKMEEV